MTPRARQRKWATLTRLPLPTILHLLQIQDGLVQPQELPPSPLLRVTSLVDHQARELQGSSRSPPVLEHQGNTQDPLQHLVGSPLVKGYLDNIHLHLELQGSSPPALEPLVSSLGSTHLKELQDSYPEALFLTQLDHFPLALEHPLGLIQMCLSQVASQEEGMACMDQAVQEDSLQLVRALSLHSLLEAFPQYLLGHGDHLQVEVSLLLLALSALALGLWVHMVGLLLQEACW